MSEEIRVLLIEPGEKPRLKTVPHTLESLQELVGGTIQAVYPFSEPVAVICDDEGKLKGYVPNRALVDEEGDFHVITADQDLASIDKTTIDGKKVINAFQFGPALVVDGQPVEDEKLVDRAHSPRDAQPDMANQRMGIMQLGKLHYMVLTCAHYGLTLPRFRDLAMYVSNYQASTIYTLDGGNSTQLIFMGQKINNVKNNGDSVRPITDIIYFASAQGADK